MVRVRAPQVSLTQARPLRAADMAAVLAACEGPLDVAVVQTMRWGMLRLGEAAALVWDDWRPDCRRGAAGCRGDCPGGRLTIVKSKTSKEPQVLWIAGPGAHALQEWRSATPDPSPRAPVFVVTYHNLGRRIARIGRRAGLEGMTGHSMRRGMAADLVAWGATSQQICSAGRWRSEAMIQLYTHDSQPSRAALAAFAAESAGG